MVERIRQRQFCAEARRVGVAGVIIGPSDFLYGAVGYVITADDEFAERCKLRVKEGLGLILISTGILLNKRKIVEGGYRLAFELSEEESQEVYGSLLE